MPSDTLMWISGIYCSLRLKLLIVDITGYLHLFVRKISQEWPWIHDTSKHKHGAACAQHKSIPCLI